MFKDTWQRDNVFLYNKYSSHNKKVEINMPTTKEKLIEELNRDLEWEYAAAIQYVQHAAVMTGAKYDSIINSMIPYIYKFKLSHL